MRLQQWPDPRNEALARAFNIAPSEPLQRLPLNVQLNDPNGVYPSYTYLPPAEDPTIRYVSGHRLSSTHIPSSINPSRRASGTSTHSSHLEHVLSVNSQREALENQKFRNQRVYGVVNRCKDYYTEAYEEIEDTKDEYIIPDSDNLIATFKKLQSSRKSGGDTSDSSDDDSPTRRYSPCPREKTHIKNELKKMSSKLSQLLKHYGDVEEKKPCRCQSKHSKSERHRKRNDSRGERSSRTHRD